VSDADDDYAGRGMSFAGKAKNPTAIDRLPASSAPASRRAVNRLDTEESQEFHRKLLSYYQQELDRQADNRVEQAEDEDFYDNLQWTPEDKAIVEGRGQMALTYNITQTAVNWVINSQKRSRTDFRILPRRKDASKPAQSKTQLMKYLSDVNFSPFHESRAFEDAVKVGIGWLESCVRNDSDGELIRDRYESWRNMLWDSACTELDLSDARYVIRTKWVDADMAKAWFPQRASVVETATRESDDYFTESEYGDEVMDSTEEYLENGSRSRASRDDVRFERERLRIIEVWFRTVTPVRKMQGGDFSGELFDEASPGHRKEIEEGRAEIIERPSMRVHVAIMTITGLLYLGESPYRHNRFPFTPLWGNRRGRDGMPYGFIRSVKDINRYVNKAASKIIHILNSSKVIMDENAVEDLDDFAEEVARPDAIIVKKKGYELQIDADRGVDVSHENFMARSIAMIQQVGGVTDENLGRETNASSGRAITARQDQGQLATAHYFENLRFAKQVHGAKMLSLIEQFIDEKKAFRITNERGTPEYLEVNDGLPENDIVSTKADFIISEQDWRATIRQAQTEELLDLMSKLAPVAPQVVLITLDLLVETMDIPARQELVARIRKQTGMSDPDADEPTPEELARQRQEAEAAELQKRMQIAQVEEKEASALQKRAAASKSEADIQKVLASVPGDNMDVKMAALEIALAMMQAPDLVPVADALLKDSGYVSETEKQEAAAIDQKAQQIEQMAAQAATQQQEAEQQPMPAEPQPV